MYYNTIRCITNTETIMSHVSSIRWNDEQLFKRAKALASAKQEKLNTLMLMAVSEYLDKYEEESMTELSRQTKAYANRQVKDEHDLDEWSSSYDVDGWE